MGNCWVKPGTACSFQHDTTVRKRLNFIMDSIEIDKDKIILDIGTGKGIYIT